MTKIVYIQSVLDKRIKILPQGLMHIYQKHVELKKKAKIFVNCLKASDEVWLSKQDSKVFLYYKRVNKKYICVICKHYNGEAFLITAYYTYKLQGKKKIWSK